ncbi:hypothetical protein CBR_g30574 [Chara braunii]|uniref:Uncharacterized protein n=1 Tax=Chara braunii TaxID=69332 RepID=A0A388LD22_CHABU|nr:hypothetical protein CBR_g30574 [Chara braunii]|eukprot:GBG80207.1 hypothetical protein CBR_g30574 [Chara braunii]
MQKVFDEQCLKKEEKARREQEKKKALECEQAEKERQKAKKSRAEKVRRLAGEKRREAEIEAERRAKMKKNKDIHLAVRLNKIEDNWFERLNQVVGRLYTTTMDKGKCKVVHQSENNSTFDDSEKSDTSIAQELNERTGRLCISEKRKRGQEHVFKDSPPMEQPPRRTPKSGILKPVQLSTRITRSKSKKATSRAPVVKTSVKTPFSVMKTPKLAKKTPQHVRVYTPVTRGALERLRYRNKMIDDLKHMDAVELQRICKEDGYDCQSISLITE